MGFRPIQRFVGAGEPLVGGLVCQSHGHTAAGGYCDIGIPAVHDNGTDEVANTVANLAGVRLVGMGQQDGELFPTKAVHTVGVSDSLLEFGGRQFQHVITHDMAVLVIHLLEMVQIAQDQRILLSMPVAKTTGTGQRLVHSTLVGNTGQAIRQ